MRCLPYEVYDRLISVSESYANSTQHGIYLKRYHWLKKINIIPNAHTCDGACIVNGAKAAGEATDPGNFGISLVEGNPKIGRL